MALLVVSCICVILAVSTIVLSIVSFQLKLKGARYSAISDIEQHLEQLNAQKNELQLNVQSYAKELAKNKQIYAKYAEVLGAYKSAIEVKNRQSELEKQNADLSKQYQQDFQKFQAILGSATELAQIQAMKEQERTELASIQNQLGILREEIEMQENGMYKRIYDFEDPASYKDKLEDVRALQRDMVRMGSACKCSINWVVEGSEAKGRKMIQEQIKLMLRAFNGECDAAIAKAKSGNIATLDKRIRKAFSDLDKLGNTKQIDFSEAYLELKILELHLTHEMEVCKQEAKERQRAIREQMADEAKAEKEIEIATRNAEREEAIKAKALEEARQQMSAEHGEHNAKLEALVSKLENELKEAIDRKAKAIARAQLTRSGHVYVLSNLGTMGKNRFKIGMTRRLDPQDRVDELGDASVPFPFDIHAMIYCEDAPALEAALHNHFKDRRTNLVNLRKEYFDVTLPEIMEAVALYHGTVTFMVDPNADQYRETLALRAEKQKQSIPLAKGAG